MTGSRQTMCNNITSAPSSCIAWFSMSRLVCLILLALPFAPAHAVEVLTSIRPLALIAQAVAGEKVVVQQLVPNGTSPHDYQLKPSDRLRLSRADIILWTGPANEAFLSRVVAVAK